MLAQAMAQVSLAAFGATRKPRGRKPVVTPAVAGVRSRVPHADNHTQIL